jgi:hypothetical protein
VRAAAAAKKTPNSATCAKTEARRFCIGTTSEPTRPTARLRDRGLTVTLAGPQHPWARSAPFIGPRCGTASVYFPNKTGRGKAEKFGKL